MNHRALAASALFAGLLLTLPGFADAQYFGRNKVQYENLNFQVLTTPNYRIHFYPEAASAIEDAARMAERWNERIARVFQHTIQNPRPLVLYADHPDFQQTNILQGRVGEGTGGVTEGLMDRIILPLGTSYADTDHVIGHELVHSFQFDIASGNQGAGLQGLMQVPLWFIEGMAEYISVGREHTLTAMWMRDAILNDEFPTLEDMTQDTRRYFPYRFGHAFWAWIAGEYGDLAVTSMMRSAARAGWVPAVSGVTGLPPDTISARWRQAAEARFSPTMEGRTPPGEAGALLLSPETGAGEQNLAPSLSPDGRYVAYLSEQDLFTIELYLADARTGETLRSLTSSTRDAHFDALRFLDTSGTWTPDGESVAVVVYSEGRNQIQFYRAEDGARTRTLDVPSEIGEIRTPAFSPDGGTIAFSGQRNGVADLFLLDVETEEVTQLTDDAYTQIQPTYSPDGRTLAYVTDDVPETSLETLEYGPMAIALMDLESRAVEQIAPMGAADHYNPQFTPDGEGLFFLADPDGFRDIYRFALDSGETWRVTNLATGVTGITEATPAITVARETGTVAFSVFDNAEYHIYALDQVESQGAPVQATELMARAGAQLGAAPSPNVDRVQPLLDRPEVGLFPPGTFSAADAEDYDARLRLAALGQPAIGVGTDQFGTFLGGSISALFSDLLGDRNLYTAVQAQGEIQDIAGQVFYQELGRRWNWGAGLSHVPYRYFGFDPSPDVEVPPGLPAGTRPIVIQEVRQFISEAVGQISYPFSSIRRAEFNASYTRRSYSIDELLYLQVPGRLPTFVEERSAPDELVPDALDLVEVQAAFVEDNSYSGFTSPVRGWRTRIEVGQTFGSLGFTSVLADHRRYFPILDELSFAVRGLHFGRYGLTDRDRARIRDLFVGQETLIRGYSTASLEPEECGGAQTVLGCPVYERLIGQRVGVVNMEARLPLLGTDRFGVINFPYLPTDLIGFVDAGAAWNAGDGVDLRWDTDPSPTQGQRIPVVSAGGALRFNLFGALVAEVYYAYPFQRPDKGAHWGFFFSPGW